MMVVVDHRFLFNPEPSFCNKSEKIYGMILVHKSKVLNTSNADKYGNDEALAA